MEETTGKELVLTPPPAEAIARRSKPRLIQLDDDRYISSDARWHPSLAHDYLSTNGRTRWIPIGELARVFFGSNIPSTKHKVRRRLPALIGRMLDENVLLVTESDSANGRVSAVKVFDSRGEQDRQSAFARVERMRQRKEMTTAQFEKAMLLIGIDEAVRAER